MNIDNKKVGGSLRDIRKSRGMTQLQLAEAIGMTSNNVARLERGEIGFTVKSLNLLAGALNVPASFLTIMGTRNVDETDSAAAQLLERTQAAVKTIIQAATNTREARTQDRKRQPDARATGAE